MIYLASPYTDKNPAVCCDRVLAACHAAHRLMESGAIVFSPVVHSSAICGVTKAPTGHKFWMPQCRAMLTLSDSMTILLLPGWCKSKGIKQEVIWAAYNAIRVRHLKPELIVPQQILWRLRKAEEKRGTA